jgi:hypothetical protein
MSETQELILWIIGDLMLVIGFWRTFFPAKKGGEGS